MFRGVKHTLALELMGKGEGTESEWRQKLQWEDKTEGFISISSLLPKVHRHIT